MLDVLSNFNCTNVCICVSVYIMPNYIFTIVQNNYDVVFMPVIYLHDAVMYSKFCYSYICAVNFTI